MDMKNIFNDLLNRNYEPNHSQYVIPNIPTILKYSNNLNHITEIGTHVGCSLLCFLNNQTLPQTIECYDLNFTNQANKIKDLSKKTKIKFNKCDIVNLKKIDITNLLFIDDWHCYAQLSFELKTFSKFVTDYILIHDTICYGYQDEKNLWNNKKVYITEKKGLIPAIFDFLNQSKEWFIEHKDENYCGLIVLKRKKIKLA